MSSHKHIDTKITTETNLIGENNYRQYLQQQADYGFSQRGGVWYPFASNQHNKRLISDVNVLTSKEHKQLIFSESILCN